MSKKKVFHFQLVGLSDHTSVFCSPIAGSWACSLCLLRLGEVKPACISNELEHHMQLCGLTDGYVHFSERS